MKITIITLFPEMFDGFLKESIVKRAQEAGAVEIELVQLRDFAKNKHNQIDDRPFGGGAGMVIMADPVVDAIKSVGGSKVLMTSPRGTVYSQEKAKEFAKEEHLVIIAGHYEAIDERVSEHIDEEISIGDYVLTGGELPAAVIVDSIVRLLPGVLKKEDATAIESFFTVSIDELRNAVGDVPELSSLEKAGRNEVQLLEYPHYTRPQEYEGKQVPEVLLSGDPKKIRVWQLQEAFKITKERRPDLLS